MTQFSKETGELSLAIHLVARLERLSADSYYAHQASGVRGALLRELERVETIRKAGDKKPSPTAHLNLLIKKGFQVLEKAAREL